MKSPGELISCGLHCQQPGEEKKIRTRFPASVSGPRTRFFGAREKEVDCHLHGGGSAYANEKEKAYPIASGHTWTHWKGEGFFSRQERLRGCPISWRCHPMAMVALLSAPHTLAYDRVNALKKEKVFLGDRRRVIVAGCYTSISDSDERRQ